MINNVILVRHGESLTNAMNVVSDLFDKYPLTERGILQAQKIADELKTLKIDAIVSSPILRARETAAIIAEKLSMNFTIDERLREIRMGKFNEKNISDVPKFTYETNVLESWSEIENRMIDVMNSYSGNVILISHGFPIRVLVAHYLGLKEDESYGIYINFATVTAINSEKMVISIGSPKITDKIQKYFC
ncbi:MAG: histidine phosphatase family protein [Thermoplasmata archaeon]